MNRLVRCLGVAALAAGSVTATTTAAGAAEMIVVRPGQSIQSAVDAAHPGDTVLIRPGVYRQSVFVSKSHLRLRGSGNGPHGTVLMPGDPEANECSQNGSGVCVVAAGTARVSDVTVDDLRAVGYTDSGVIASHARNLLVRNVVANDNGEYGIARFDTTGGSLIANTTIGNGEAGLYVGDSAHADVFVAGNRAAGNAFGILFRHSRHATFQYNAVQGNCIGIFLVSAAPTTPPAGAASVQYNSVRHDTKFCPGNPDEVPFDQRGGGIVLLGTTGVTVANNAVLNNRGSTPVSGGIVLLNGAPLGGGPATGNVVRNNTAYGNAPADIVDSSDGRNVIRNNFCRVSQPGGLCRH